MIMFMSCDRHMSSWREHHLSSNLFHCYNSWQFSESGRSARFWANE